ncbi:type IV pilin-like G/H family protein [Pantanalinema sp. GBBB05]|uniref:type IV pilin-like G/H family protein n=1 Tax=Pantanalinema sp. GBBB05 TaxID=2604139 RepID=UPI001E005B14|nr:hypothetical protein [Pantanalinema sp. GBBB05]
MRISSTSYRLGIWLFSGAVLLGGVTTCRESLTSKLPLPDQVASVLVGRWIFRNQARHTWNFNDALIFLPDRTFIAINGDDVVRGRYWINVNTRPMHIDLALADPHDWFRGSFALPDPQTLLLERKIVGNTAPARPTEIRVNQAFVYHKVSEQTTLPPEVGRIRDQVPSVVVREQLGRGYIIQMMFAQREYFDRTKTYALRLSQIQAGFYEEDIDYQYQVIPKSANWIWMIAQAKHPDLRSFTAEVGRGFIACAANQPSFQPPRIVPSPLNPRGYACDATSHEFTF